MKFKHITLIHYI